MTGVHTLSVTSNANISTSPQSKYKKFALIPPEPRPENLPIPCQTSENDSTAMVMQQSCLCILTQNNSFQRNMIKETSTAAVDKKVPLLPPPLKKQKFPLLSQQIDRDSLTISDLEESQSEYEETSRSHDREALVMLPNSSYVSSLDKKTALIPPDQSKQLPIPQKQQMNEDTSKSSLSSKDETMDTQIIVSTMCSECSTTEKDELVLSNRSSGYGSMPREHV